MTDWEQRFAGTDWETRFPFIPWREPIRVTVPGLGSGLGCRICIAERGMRGVDVMRLPRTEAEHAAHMQQEHP